MSQNESTTVLVTDAKNLTLIDATRENSPWWWTENNKMIINKNKTKNIVFNFTDKYQFSTRLTLKNQPIEVVKNIKLLGTIVSDDLSWDLNTKNLVKRANARMELLRRVASFGAPAEDLKIIYIIY